jgi:hypothetical protein
MMAWIESDSRLLINVQGRMRFQYLVMIHKFSLYHIISRLS